MATKTQPIKIYCVLFDTMPLIAEIRALAVAQDLQLLLQVGNCFTATSMISMFTGKMPSDYLRYGMGYSTVETYRDKESNTIKFPWAHQILHNQLAAKGWDIHLHNVIPTNYWKGNLHTDSYPGGYWKKYQICHNSTNPRLALSMMDPIFLNNDADAQAWQDRELKWIESPHEINNNTFYFIEYLHHHSYGSLINSGCRDPKESLKKHLNMNLMELMRAWNFNEPNTIFWFFSDHGEQRPTNVIPKADSYVSWVLFKNNTDKSLEAVSKLISIRDFSPTILKIIGYPYVHETESKPLDESMDDKNRIFYVEDGRKRFDEHRSTTAVACKPIAWNEFGIPKHILQTCYFSVTGKYYNHLNQFKNNGELEISVDIGRQNDNRDDRLKKALQERFKWIPK